MAAAAVECPPLVAFGQVSLDGIMPDRSIQHLLSWMRREIGASEVGITPPGGDAPSGRDVVATELPRGHVVWARLVHAPKKRTTVLRKLAAMAESFVGLLEDAPISTRPRKRTPRIDLRQCLRALATAVGAQDALVLDARSPVVWGSASGLSGDVLGHPHLVVLGRQDRLPASGRGAPVSLRQRIACRVIEQVRSFPAVAHLSRGGHLRKSGRVGETGYMVRSFASIYLLLLVFPKSFDQVRAAREVTLALPRIEALVIALPPQDPASGATSLRHRRPK